MTKEENNTKEIEKKLNLLSLEFKLNNELIIKAKEEKERKEFQKKQDKIIERYRKLVEELN